MNTLISDTYVEISKNEKWLINIHKPYGVCYSLMKNNPYIWRGTKCRSIRTDKFYISLCGMETE